MDERLTIAEPVAAKLKALTLALVEYRDGMPVFCKGYFLGFLVCSC